MMVLVGGFNVGFIIDRILEDLTVDDPNNCMVWAGLKHVETAITVYHTFNVRVYNLDPKQRLRVAHVEPIMLGHSRIQKPWWLFWQNMILVKPHSLLWVKQNCQSCTPHYSVVLLQVVT
jgi:hypothetical protein